MINIKEAHRAHMAPCPRLPREFGKDHHDSKSPLLKLVLGHKQQGLRQDGLDDLRAHALPCHAVISDDVRPNGLHGTNLIPASDALFLQNFREDGYSARVWVLRLLVMGWKSIVLRVGTASLDSHFCEYIRIRDLRVFKESVIIRDNE